VIRKSTNSLYRDCGIFWGWRLISGGNYVCHTSIVTGAGIVIASILHHRASLGRQSASAAEFSRRIIAESEQMVQARQMKHAIIAPYHNDDQLPAPE